MTVVRMVGRPKAVEAIVYGEVGLRGLVFVATILVGGTGCIAAYLIEPDCSLKGIRKSEATPDGTAAAAAAAATILLTVAGAVVAVIGAMTGANVPVTPVRLNLGEKFVIVPEPVFGVDNMPIEYTFFTLSPTAAGIVTIMPDGFAAYVPVPTLPSCWRVASGPA